MSEAVALDRGGEAVAAASDKSIEAGSEPKDSALAGVARAVARTVKQQVRELELGSFRRCVLEGPFGTVVVGETGRGLAAARARRGTEGSRLWERMTVAFEGVKGRAS